MHCTDWRFKSGPERRSEYLRYALRSALCFMEMAQNRLEKCLQIMAWREHPRRIERAVGEPIFHEKSCVGWKGECMNARPDPQFSCPPIFRSSCFRTYVPFFSSLPNLSASSSSWSMVASWSILGSYPLKITFNYDSVCWTIWPEFWLISCKLF